MTIVSSSRKSIRKFLFALSSIAFASLLLVASRPAVAQQNGLPPIIDRELFFGDPEISGAQISPDGKLIAYFYVDAQANDQSKLSIIPFEGGEPVTTINLSRTAAGSGFGFVWMPDGRSIAYIDAGGGIQNAWSQPIDGSAPKQLTNFKSEFIASFAISRDGKQIAVNRVTSTSEIVLIKGFR